MTALILVDIQNDFMPGGALPIEKGDQILPIIDDLLEYPFDAIVATQDWHPKDHKSFAEQHGKEPGECVIVGKMSQILWPTHCIQGTRGAAFAPGWQAQKVGHVFHKGVEKDIDSYSTFYDNGHLRSTGLGEFLRNRNITDIYIAGLATDYCVKYSALDANKEGFNVFVIIDACKAVNLYSDDEEGAIQVMKKAGVHMITSKEIALHHV
jgi:nicotinamidase/pyrazinamidase